MTEPRASQRIPKERPKTVLILGSGPIVIGQACEFDYSGTQACRALREEGIRTVLLNSNPATIMTDPGISDRTYVEPMLPQTVIEILRQEKVDAILPTMGGQTALNLVTSLSTIPGALDGVEVIGANLKSIHLAEDRRAFREVLETLGLDSPRSTVVRSLEEAQTFAKTIGFPLILRPSFTLGGTGQSFVFSEIELETKVLTALAESPIGEALVEESVLGWKEYELEVMRDCKDNAIVVCSIENLDPMGIHTGDSITCAPAQTLTDVEYQAMRADALKLLRKIGVETGGCNVQFAVNPQNGRRIVIEMNPRVSRSSALASKATGFPIAYVATKLALGYALSDIQNNITQTTRACFEPPLDYVAVKIPRWNFEKFPGTSDVLGPQMQSVGEVLSLGGSLGEAFHKALVGLEQKWPKLEKADAKILLTSAHSQRAYAVWDALAFGVDPKEISEITSWDPWFLREIRRYQTENSLGPRCMDFSKASPVRFEWVDTSAAEIPAKTPFFYSTREVLGDSFKFEDSRTPKKNGNLEDFGIERVSFDNSKFRGRVVILGSGPNRIGQGVEFDYCCVHASLSLKKLGFETIMHNCNPETVSTDPQVSSRLYLEPITEQSVRTLLARELDPVIAAGAEGFVLVQTGGQTPLKVAKAVESWGYKVLGTANNAIDLCEDRARFAQLLESLDIAFPQFRQATSLEETLAVGNELGFPLLVRPSYVLGGRAMKICANKEDLHAAFDAARAVSEEYPLFIDRFLPEAVEFDIDGICDGKKAWLAGVMEHVEEAGIHSGDSSCVIPPIRLPAAKIDEMAGLAKKIALKCGVRGFFNIQMAVMKNKIYVLEANPRASRTVPFLSKATGYPILDWGIRAALGESLEVILQKEAEIPGNYRLPGHGYAVKAPVFPFQKFREFDPILGPEMRSTGEVMGVDKTLGGAFAKAFLAAGISLPVKGEILFSVTDDDKPRALSVARLFSFLGFQFSGTPGTADYLRRAGLECRELAKIGQSQSGGREGLLDYLKARKCSLVINTTGSLVSLRDRETIRTEALRNRIPLLSTLAAAEMASMAIETLTKKGIRPTALQDFVAV